MDEKELIDFLNSEIGAKLGQAVGENIPNILELFLKKLTEEEKDKIVEEIFKRIPNK